MSTCAVCQLLDGLVINLIVAEPTDIPPDNCELIISPDVEGNYANIGFTWNGTIFINPNPPIPEEIPEEIFETITETIIE
jgi:hypothetical protein